MDYDEDDANPDDFIDDYYDGGELLQGEPTGGCVSPPSVKEK